MCASAQNASGQKGMIWMGVYRLPDRHSKYLARQRQFRSGLFLCAQTHRTPWKSGGWL